MLGAGVCLIELCTELVIFASQPAGNTLRQNLLGTGAFEVSYDGTPIFSKLELGRMPTLPELVGGISEAMAAAGGAPGGIPGVE
jgi:hypothetical protein